MRNFSLNVYPEADPPREDMAFQPSADGSANI